MAQSNFPALTVQQVQTAYLAFFNRPADPAGLAYWTSSQHKGGLPGMWSSFGLVPEFAATFGNKPATEIVETFYVNMFGRPSDAAGKTYWLAELSAGRVDIGNLAAAFDAGAAPADKTILSGKVVANTATTQAAIDAVLPGTTFLLTTGVDKGAAFTGTGKADTFKADILTLSAGDELDGGAGQDTLNATLNNSLDSSVKINNVEAFNITALGAITLDAKNFIGLQQLTTKDSVAKVTLNNMSDAKVSLGFSGALSNSIEASYIAGALSGSSDMLNIVTNGATAGVKVVVPAGFETVQVLNSGTSLLETLTLPGVSTAVLKGSGELKLKGDGAANPLSGMKTVTATDFTGTLVGSTISSGFSTQGITGSVDGSSLILGGGGINLKFTSAATGTGTTLKSNNILMGNGINTLDFVQQATNGGTNIFGGTNTDTVRISGEALRTTDLISLGAGNDTVILNSNHAHQLTLLGVENLTLSKAAIGANVVTQSELALTVIAQAGSSTNATAANITGLSKGSTVTVNNASLETAGLAALTVGFAVAEAANTINVNSKMSDAVLTATNIAALTVNFADVKAGNATPASSADVVADKATSITLNASKAFMVGDVGNAADGVGTLLKTLVVAGQDAVTVGAATSTVLESVQISAQKAASMGAMGEALKLKSISVSSSTDNATVGAVGAASKNNTVDALDVAVSGGKSTTVGTIGNATDAGKLGTVSFNASNGTVDIGAIVASSVGTITYTSNGTTGTGNIDAGNITAADSTGIAVNFSAKGAISADGAHDGTATAVQNTGGNITATVSGTTAVAGQAKAANINFTTVTSGVVNLNASNTGGLATTVTNAGTAGASQTSTLVLGNALDNKTNTLIVKGTVDILNITGGSGADVVKFDAANTIKTGTIALAGGVDTLDLSGLAAGSTATLGTAAANIGVIINLSNSPFTVGTGSDATSIVAGRAAEFKATDAKKIVNTKLDLQVSGIEVVVGTGGADTIIASNTGNTITGGAGGDTIVLGAGKDSIIYGGTNAATFKTEIGTNFNDTILNFTKGTDTISFAAATITATAAESAAAFNLITTAAKLDDTKINFIKGAVFNTEADYGNVDTVTAALAGKVTVAATDTATTGGDAMDDIIFAITNGTDTFVYLYNGSATSGTAAPNGTDSVIEALELLLIAKLVGVSDLAAGDFIIV